MALIGLMVVLFVANVYLFKSAARTWAGALHKIIAHGPPRPRGPRRPGSAAGAQEGSH